MKKTLTSWSFSRYNVYKLCPLKAKLAFIDGIKEPQSEAMARGDAIHGLAEGYIKGEIARIPAELKLFAVEFRKLRKLYKQKIGGAIVEDNWSFTNAWAKTRWDDWVNCWVRIKLDCAHYEDFGTLVITDWKTGKFRQGQHEEYLEQLELYALAALLLHPQVTRVKPRLAYLDLGVVYPAVEKEIIYTQQDIPRLKQTWEARTQAMLNDKIFAPRANNKCKWCFYRASNKDAGGGQCKY